VLKLHVPDVEARKPSLFCRFRTSWRSCLQKVIIGRLPPILSRKGGRLGQGLDSQFLCCFGAAWEQRQQWRCRGGIAGFYAFYPGSSGPDDCHSWPVRRAIGLILMTNRHKTSLQKKLTSQRNPKTRCVQVRVRPQLRA
jgi:hypothetical protein